MVEGSSQEFAEWRSGTQLTVRMSVDPGRAQTVTEHSSFLRTQEHKRRLLYSLVSCTRKISNIVESNIWLCATGSIFCRWSSGTKGNTTWWTEFFASRVGMAGDIDHTRPNSAHCELTSKILTQGRRVQVQGMPSVRV